MRHVLFGVILLLITCICEAKKYKLVEIETNLGIIKVRLFEDTPKHSENFLKLVKEKHYDSLLFHRVIKDFMIQGGASDSKRAAKDKGVGMSDPGYTIEAEFRPGNIHVKGALAAARELYKSVGGTPFLDGDYTVFGEVVEGMDILDKIATVKTTLSDRPEKDVMILSTKLRKK